MSYERNVLRGAAAGMVGGLVASWVMSRFMTSAGPTIEHGVASAGGGDAPFSLRGNGGKGAGNGAGNEEATMKAADSIVSTVTGGRHLSHAAKKKSGPVVHYAFGSMMGALYGGLAEYAPAVSTGLGTTFGTALFAGADLFAVPALGLSEKPAEQPTSKLASPFLAHLVYGFTTDLVRRALH